MPLIVVESKGPALLGRDWLSKIRVDWKFIKSLKENKPTDGLIQKHSSLFDGQLGKVRDIKVKLELKEGATPRFSRHGRYHMLSGSQSKRSWIGLFQRTF